MSFKRIFIVVLFFTLLLTLACRKDPDHKDPVDPCDCDTLMIMSETYFVGQTFKYDSLGRILNYKNNDVGQSAYVSWRYTGDRLKSITRTGFWGELDSIEYTGNTGTNFYDNEGLFWPDTSIQITLTLDVNNYAINCEFAHGYYTDSLSYHYNASFILDSVVNHTQSAVEKLYYTNGLLSEVICYDSNETVTRVQEYFYDDQGRWTKYIITQNGYSAAREYFYNQFGQLIGSNGSNPNDPDSEQFEIIYNQTGCGNVINLKPINFYRYPHYRLIMFW